MPDKSLSPVTSQWQAHTRLQRRCGFLLPSCAWVVSPSCLSSLCPEGQQLPLLAAGPVLGSESLLPSRPLFGCQLRYFLAG